MNKKGNINSIKIKANLVYTLIKISNFKKRKNKKSRYIKRKIKRRIAFK